jgi:hypothetical protein
MHYYGAVHNFHVHDLDHLKTPEPPANLMSVQYFKLC